MPLILALACLALLLPASASAAPELRPGAPGIGDPYFPLDGNGGYDVRHYDLRLDYRPATDVLTGVATIRARATQGLSRFDLDFSGLHVRSVAVDGRRARWRRDGGEMVVRPRAGVRRGAAFTVRVAYRGVPKPIGEPGPGGEVGFIPTADGALVVGEMDVAPTWFPVNDHPSDKASYTFHITVPAGLEAVANGVLAGRHTRGGRTTWTWRAREPMASYLTTMAIGEYTLRARRIKGIRYWDAIDTELLAPTGEPRTGRQFAISQRADLTYKRLARTIDVPASGGHLSFWTDRSIEPFGELAFVEARPVGTDDWTMLPDLNGHTSSDPGPACPYLIGLHPFLAHYATPDGEESCAPHGTTGAWAAVGGATDGYEPWEIDLSPYAGRRIELSISVVTDDYIASDGVFVDDVVAPVGQGSTSFEDDGDTLDGWHVLGPAPGSAPNANDWIAGTVADAPPSQGQIAERVFDRQPEIIDFLEHIFGPYPFAAGGGILDDVDEIGFALETQTRPVYSLLLMTNGSRPLDVIAVHELAHQWAGDDVSLARWRDVWLNEGFATYAEWLWSEHEGGRTAQAIYDELASRPADDPLWSVVVADPGPDALFDSAVSARGAATLHALRMRIGDADFFRLLRRWPRAHAGANATTADFEALAERISGADLGAFFHDWLHSATKPPEI